MAAIEWAHRRNGISRERAEVSFVQSQLVLFRSRVKWGVLYALATVAGLFCVPGINGFLVTDIVEGMKQNWFLPFISLLIATGMYILNDLVDSDLDKANGKKRPYLPAEFQSRRRGFSSYGPLPWRSCYQC